jgi:uncharacterized protein YfiM (DUF2279 family)
MIRAVLLTAALGGAAALQADADPLMSTQQPASRLWPTPVDAPQQAWRRGARRDAPQRAGPSARRDAPRQAWRGVPRAATPRPLEGDAWLGADKFQHFWMSFATTAYGFAAARTAGIDTGAALYIAVPVSAAAGVGKEIHDRRRGGIFSVRDLVADGLGIAAAWFILREVR